MVYVDGLHKCVVSYLPAAYLFSHVEVELKALIFLIFNSFSIPELVIERVIDCQIGLLVDVGLPW